jgi:DNA topoisomerase-3
MVKAYTLKSLQDEAARMHGYDARTVREALQKLYEMKYISYPFTECAYLPDALYAEHMAEVSKVTRYAARPFVEPTQRPPVYDDSQLLAHHGIVPVPEPKGLEDIQNVWDLTQVQMDLFCMVAERLMLIFGVTDAFTMVRDVSFSVAQ